MKAIATILILIGALSIAIAQNESDSLKSDFDFNGQLSSWIHFNPNNDYAFNVGARYLPQIKFKAPLKSRKLIDIELSGNIYGTAGIDFFDSVSADGGIDPYRAWARYSTQQFELRVGLQKIDFGSASMLRALRWFDQVDPRDPLQLTDGVWAGLGRYYFLNNVNLWVWSLYGNKNVKGMEFIKTNKSIPEFGGRFQFPISVGEAALSYHHRVAKSLVSIAVPGFEIESAYNIPENRIGVDAKLDLVVGLWVEGAWVNKKENIGMLTNQEVLTLGTDYTFGIGSGLNITFEHMMIANDEIPFEFKSKSNFSALSMRYPVGMFDTVNAIVYYNWTDHSVYNFVNWYRQFDKTILYMMAYWNPDKGQLPTPGGGQNLYGSAGLQLMFVFNH